MALPLSYALSHFHDFYFKIGIRLAMQANLELSLQPTQALNVASLLPLLPEKVGLQACTSGRPSVLRFQVTAWEDLSGPFTVDP